MIFFQKKELFIKNNITLIALQFVKTNSPSKGD